MKTGYWKTRKGSIAHVVMAFNEPDKEVLEYERFIGWVKNILEKKWHSCSWSVNGRYYYECGKDDWDLIEFIGTEYPKPRLPFVIKEKHFYKTRNGDALYVAAIINPDIMILDYPVICYTMPGYEHSLQLYLAIDGKYFSSASADDSQYDIVEFIGTELPEKFK